MKLSTKIVLGFMLITATFIILVGVVYSFMRPVRDGAVNLSENLLDLLEEGSAIQYNLSAENFEVRSYLLFHQEEYWQRARERSAQVMAAFDDVDRNLNTPNAASINIPAVLEPFRALKADYVKYRELADQVPVRQKSLIVTRAQLLAVHEAFEALLNDCLRLESGYLDQLNRGGGSPGEVARSVARLDQIREIQALGYRLVITSLRGVVENNQTFFLEAQKLNTQTIERARALTGESLPPEARALGDELLRNLGVLEGVLDKTVTDNAASVESAGVRGALTGAITLNAGRLKEIGQEMSVKVVNETSRAVSLVVMALLIGAGAAVLMSVFSAWAITRSITRPINHLIEILSEGAQEVDGASDHLSHASHDLADGAAANAASLEETSAALEELSSMTRRNADNAAEADALMSQASQAVQAADSSMEGVIKAMEEIATSGNEISKIIKTIDEIAFQTNLLALNAAVEAARAGEAGSGFAVVADEVRNLAIRSADAAKSTAGLIAATIANINSGSELVNTAAANFKQVEQQSHKIAELLSEVAEASKEQNQGIGQITTAMNEMDKVTQVNAASAEESAGAAGQLSLQAGNLLSAVDEMTTLVHGANGNGHRPPANGNGRANGRGNGRVAVPPPPVKTRPALPAADDSFDF